MPYNGIGIGIGYGGYAPSSIPSSLPGLLSWYESDFGFTLDGSNNLQSWSDKSGNGFDLTQAVAGSRPARTLSSINGYPAASFVNAGTKFMTATTTFAGGNHSMLIVIKPTGACSVFGGGITMGSNNVSFQTSTIGIQNTNNLWFGGAGSGGGDAGIPSVGSVYVLGKTLTSNVYQIFENGAFTRTQTEGTVVTPLPTTTQLLGMHAVASLNSPIDVAACITYNRPLTSSEMIGVQNYLLAKYT